MNILPLKEKGKKVLTTGDMAIARGALEAGIGFFATYPGTPASGVGDHIYEVREQLRGLYFEYSMNEKIAVEGAIGAALAGIRSMAAMKHLGMNVAADSIHHITNREIVRGMVIVNGSDPGQQASATEQDNRYYSLHTHLPVIQPGNVQEAKDFTRLAFELSDRFCLPFVIDAPTVLMHGRGQLELGELPHDFPAAGAYQPKAIVDEIRLIGRTGRHKLLLKQEAQIREYAAHSPLNRIIEGSRDWAIITCGVAFGYVLEALDILKLKEIPVLKLGLVHPLSPEMIGEFIKNFKKVVIVEESEGFLENQIKVIAYDLNLGVEIKGKEWFSPVGMQSASRIAIELSTHLGLPLPNQFSRLPGELIENTERLASILALPAGESIPIPGFVNAPRRIRAFCPGCPHRGAAYAIKSATRGKALVGGDIGCYNISALPPFELYSWHFCMGAGLGIGQGMTHKLPDTPIIAMIGDSTLFHSGLPAVLNAAYNNSDILLIVLDNRWTSMTGHQPTPSTSVTLTNELLNPVSIPRILESLGVQWVRTADPFHPRKMVELIKQGLNQKGTKAIVAEGECALQSGRRKRQLEIRSEVIYEINNDTCKRCDICFIDFGCPAIVRRQSEDGSSLCQIDQGLCNQCGACAAICPSEAIMAISREQMR